MMLVKATDADIARFYGVKLTGEWFGWAIKSKQMIVGIGGAYNYSGNDWVCFVDQKSKVLKPIHLRLARKAVAQLSRIGAERVTAMCDERIKGADTFLKRIGFVEQDEGVWECQV